MKKLALVFGTRPEAIKMAPIERELRHRQGILCTVCLTAQHRQMLDQVLRAFSMEVDVDLDLMREAQDPLDLLARTMLGLQGWLKQSSPDLVMVQGDTTSALGAGLAAFHLGIPVAHVEAGLRTLNLQAPWPEEANRQLISRIASLHFAPTPGARDNLLAEGVAADAIEVTGNTVVDALLQARRRIESAPPEVVGVPEAVLVQGEFVLLTGHRRENFGGPLRRVCSAIAILADRFPTVYFVYPVHLNPRVREEVRSVFGPGQRRNVLLVEPVDYLSFVRLLSSCRLIITDSGGVQEEAPTFGVPVLITRESTERPEALREGLAEIVGTDEQKIVEAVTRALNAGPLNRDPAKCVNPFGDGRAARRIVDACLRFLHCDDPVRGSSDR